MQYNKVTVPVIGYNPLTGKLRAQYQGKSIEVEAFSFQLKPEFMPKTITCILGRDRDARVKLTQDLQEVLDNIYEEEGQYDFKVVSVMEDSTTHQQYLQLRDEYGIKHRLYGIDKRVAYSAVGKIIHCEVQEIVDGHLVLQSPDYQEGVDRVVADDSISKMDAGDLDLFDRLHTKRSRQFESINDRSLRGVWASVIDKYPDSAHFIYELLQNADDAEATEVTIYIGKDVLYFKHNGSVQFSVTDDDDENVSPGHINAIVGVGNSSKDDGNKIGKFGVGFKAVFQYTDTPKIYSDDFKFQIVNYIVPELIPVDCEYRKPGETLFEIPFKNPDSCYKEILDKLNHLKSPILFLNNIKKVTWKDITLFNHEKVYSKKVIEKFTDGDVKCEKIIEDSAGKLRYIWLFTRDIELSKGVRYPVSVGYYLKDDNGHETLDTDIRPEVFCFFATSEKFDSCFISHAPFLLVDNRQQVKEHEKVNITLRDAICTLAADALPILRDIGLKNENFLLDDNIFKIVPLEETDEDDMKFICNGRLYDSMFSRMKSDSLLLSRAMEYVGPNRIRIALPVSLLEVVNSDQLSELVQSQTKPDFLAKAPGRDTRAYSYLINDLKVEKFTSEDLAKAITPEFITARNFEWVIRLYRFLNEDARELWNANARYQSRGSLSFRYAPIVKTTTGRWVPPYEGSNINVFFSVAEGASDYNIVADEYYNHEAARKFLVDLGIKEPDMWDYIQTHVIPKYKEDNFELEDDVLLSDFDTLLQYSGKVEVDNQDSFYQTLRDYIYFAAVDQEGESMLHKPSQIYYPSKELQKYFAGHTNYVFFDTEFYAALIKKYSDEKIRRFLKQVGVSFSPKIVKIDIKDRYSLSDEQKEALGTSRSSYHPREYGEDYQMVGLENALNNNLTRSLSVQIWNWLSDKDLTDSRYLKFHFHYRTYYTQRMTSSLVSLLMRTPWIYVSQKTRKPANDISLEQFEALEDYKYSSTLFDIFGIVRKKISLEELGADSDQIKSYNTGIKFEELIKESGLSESEAKEAIKKAAEEKRKKAEKKKLADENKAAIEHKDMKDYSAEEMFSGQSSHQDTRQNQSSGVEAAKANVSQENQSSNDVVANERIEEIKKKQQEEIDHQQKQEELRVKVSTSEKYSKEWFQSLLSLECEHEGDNVESFGRKTVSITFTKVIKDHDSDRIYVLKYPSRTIPLEIEQIGGLEVSFSFYDLEDLKLGFEVASVKDFSLRLKAKLVDSDKLKGIDWSKCSKAEVQINNSVALVEKLTQAFAELDIPDGTNLKESLPDNFSFVFGPPGTGKTTCLAGKICDLMSNPDEGCRILVLAPTNKACDVLACKVADNAPSTEWLGRFLTGSEQLEEEGLIIDKTSDLYQQDRCCIVTTMARLPYDGFGSGYETDYLRDIQWDYVIIDEASMIPLAQIVYAIYRFDQSKIIIAGDPKQISPIVREEAWKKENIYTMVNLQRFRNPITEPRQFNIENLETQYRSIPQIGRVFSEYAYDGLLKHKRNTEDQRTLDIKGLDFLKPINFLTFKVNKYDDICAPRKLSSSNVHVYSVIFLVELCKYIFRMYEKGKTKKNNVSIGIICPYAAQAQMIDKLLEQCKEIPPYIKITVGTIHGFQGDECDVVFVMFNPPKGLKGATDRVLVNDPNIINVAISRARDYLFILMPEKEMYGFECLYQIISMGNIVVKESGSYSVNTADKIEQIIFGEKGYIEKNTFVTTHQLANVYSKPASLYEVRIDDNSVDIQID